MKEFTSANYLYMFCYLLSGYVVKDTGVVGILDDGTCILNLPKRISPF